MNSRELAAYVADQLAGLPEVRHIPMMGGYIFYYREKIIGGIYEPGFLLKDAPSARAAMPEAQLVPWRRAAGRRCSPAPSSTTGRSCKPW